MTIDRSQADMDWLILDEQGNVAAWPQATVAVLMDIRRELEAAERGDLLPELRRDPTHAGPDQTEYRQAAEEEGGAMPTALIIGGLWLVCSLPVALLFGALLGGQVEK